MQQLRLVIIDDDPDDLYLLQDIMQQTGVGYIDCFSDPQKCLEALKECPPQRLPHIIITDLNMPRLSGFELLTKLRQLPHLNNAVLIVCSTSNDQKNIDLSMALGARDYLIKPTTYTDYYKLADRIRQFAGVSVQ